MIEVMQSEERIIEPLIYEVPIAALICVGIFMGQLYLLFWLSWFILIPEGILFILSFRSHGGE